MLPARVIGFSASLRNARNREGSKQLVADIKKIKDERTLIEYLANQGNIHLEHYYNAGRAQGIPADKLYENLKTIGGGDGLSNSEVCLAAALWGAYQEGAEIDHYPLADFFMADGLTQNLDHLRTVLLGADGIIIATPVYFGDRSSLSQSFIEMIKQDQSLRKALRGKPYGGVAVGAKRNGGQETTLIYQMHDMMDIGLLAVGNDFETTSQYGGTGHAGELATMAKDESGLKTCIGTGKRVTRVSLSMHESHKYELNTPLNVGIWLLQDKDHIMENFLAPYIRQIEEQNVNVKLIKMHDMHFQPCMACDYCPAIIGPDEKYRCIRGKSDSMYTLHNELLSHDVIIPALYSPKDRKGLASIYQHFLERTRYLRRGDYVFTDRLIVPMILAEVGTNENMNIRMTSSLIRHHTVLQKPIMGWLHKGNLLNPEGINHGLEYAIEFGRYLLIGRLAMVSKGGGIALYKPVGYVLSLTKDNLPQTLSKREDAIKLRLDKLRLESDSRLKKILITDKN
jgi:multimeric flavodoxin WrbA